MADVTSVERAAEALAENERIQKALEVRLASEVKRRFPNNQSPYDLEEYPGVFWESLRVLERARRLRTYKYLPSYVPLARYLFYHDVDPTLELHYPLTEEHLCTKGLWYPTIVSIVKTSTEQFRDDKHQESIMASTPKPKQEAEQVGLKVCLMSTQALFENRQSLPERTFDKVMDTTKKILGRSQRHADVRSVKSSAHQPSLSSVFPFWNVLATSTLSFMDYIHMFVSRIGVTMTYVFHVIDL